MLFCEIKISFSIKSNGESVFFLEIVETFDDFFFAGVFDVIEIFVSFKSGIFELNDTYADIGAMVGRSAVVR